MPWPGTWPQPTSDEIRRRFWSRVLRRAHSLAGAASLAALTAVFGALGLSWWYIGPVLALCLLSFALFLAWRDEYFECKQADARATYYQEDAKKVRHDAGRLEIIDVVLRSGRQIRRGAEAALRDEGDVREAVALQSRLGDWASNAHSRLPSDLVLRLEEAGGELLLNQPGLPTGSPREQVTALDNIISELRLIEAELRQEILIGKALRHIEPSESDLRSVEAEA